MVEGDLTSVSMTVGGAMNKYNMFAAFHNNHIITFIMKPQFQKMNKNIVCNISRSLA